MNLWYYRFDDRVIRVKKIEPLLKEEVETFGFLQQENKMPTSKGTNKKAYIITGILAVIVLLLTYKFVYAFYMGFKYFDDAHVKNSEPSGEKVKDEQEISLNSVVLNDTYGKINVSRGNLALNIYNGNAITKDNITDSVRLGILFKTLGLDCDNLNISVSYEALVAEDKKIFGNDEGLESLQNAVTFTIDEYNITYDEATNLYNVSMNVCDDNNFIVKNISKATTSGEDLYIYEYFGYFVNNGDNTYNVYGDSLQTGNVITTFIDNDGQRHYGNIGILATYKWTYKKSNDNNYYFSSVTRQ